MQEVSLFHDEILTVCGSSDSSFSFTFSVAFLLTIVLHPSIEKSVTIQMTITPTTAGRNPPEEME